MMYTITKINEELFKPFIFNRITVLVFCSFIFISCNSHSSSKTKKNKTTEQKEKLISDSTNINDEQKFTGIDNLQEKDKALSFLKAKGIINSDYPDEKIVSYRKIKSNGIIYSLLKIKYDKSLGSKYSNDPIINFLYIKENNNLINKIVLYSANEEDFKFSFKQKNTIFYEYYDSTTGWLKYYSYLIKKNVFVETRELDEAEKIDKKAIFTDSLTYKVKDNPESEKFKIIP